MLLMGPHTFECTISRGLVARIPPSLGNGLQCCFPSMHPSETNEDVRQGMFPRFIPLTMFWSACTPLMFTWPSRRCQSSNAPSIVEVWAWLATCISHTLVKVIWYKLPLRSAIAITSLLKTILWEERLLIQKTQRSHKYVNNAWRVSSNSPPTLLFIPFPVPPHWQTIWDNYFSPSLF